MITKDQANSIADSLLRQQRAETLRAKNVTNSRVSFLYQCPELQLLEPWQRNEVVREAKRRLRSHWGIIVCLLVWVAVFTAFWILLVPTTTRLTFPLWWIAMLAMPPFALHLSLIRLHVRYLATYVFYPCEHQL